VSDEIQQLFENGGSGVIETRQLVVLTRHGHPLLYLPHARAQAKHALALYPAQRAPARLARGLMRLASTLGLLRFFPSTMLSVNTDGPLAGFLETRSKRESLPPFAILAGNPNTPGRRFILLLFDEHDRPCAVVKAGITPEAIRLLKQEAAVLDQAPSSALGLPRLQAVQHSPRVCALALDYIAGEPPQADIATRLPEVLGSWVTTSRTVTAEELRVWQRLVAACPNDPTLNALRSRVESARFHPALHHGDFAPWNIKVVPDGSWRVLDWERGERNGPPCWDWFHYHIQVGLLVNRLPAVAHAQRIDGWLADKAFEDYSATAGVQPLIRELLLTYLLYSLEVTQPSEGLHATRELLNVLAQRWNVA